MVEKGPGQDIIIKGSGLAKHFGEVHAVDEVDLQIFQGEILAIVGSNGAGKTTTINILCTLTRPTSGRASISGFDVVRQQNKVRQAIGLVFQDPSLDDQLTGLQNLRFHASVYNVSGSIREQRIEQVLKMTELWDRRNNQVRTYSGGMKRRLELARGLLHHPKVLFLDEPTLGLDPQTRNRIWEYIVEMQRQEGTTLFLTTHYMDEADKANRIAIMDRGKLIAMDTPENLKKIASKDIITVKTADDDKSIAEIKLRYGIEARRSGSGLNFDISNGDEFLPSFIKGFGVPILSVSMHRPSLEDVFLKLTGREIREESVDAMKAFVGMHGRHMRH